MDNHYTRLDRLVREYVELSAYDEHNKRTSEENELRDRQARGRAVSIGEMLLVTGMYREIGQRATNEQAAQARNEADDQACAEA